MKIADFLLIVHFYASPIFYCSYFTYILYKKHLFTLSKAAIAPRYALYRLKIDWKYFAHYKCLQRFILGIAKGIEGPVEIKIGKSGVFCDKKNYIAGNFTPHFHYFRRKKMVLSSLLFFGIISLYQVESRLFKSITKESFAEGANPIQLNYGVAVSDVDGDGDFEFIGKSEM